MAHALFYLGQDSGVWVYQFVYRAAAAWRVLGGFLQGVYQFDFLHFENLTPWKWYRSPPPWRSTPISLGSYQSLPVGRAAKHHYWLYAREGLSPAYFLIRKTRPGGSGSIGRRDSKILSGSRRGELNNSTFSTKENETKKDSMSLLARLSRCPKDHHNRDSSPLISLADWISMADAVGFLSCLGSI